MAQPLTVDEKIVRAKTIAQGLEVALQCANISENQARTLKVAIDGPVIIDIDTFVVNIEISSLLSTKTLRKRVVFDRFSLRVLEVANG